MKYSTQELKKLAGLKPETTVEEIMSAMTSLGFEVEGFQNFAPVQGIKFGKILEIWPNPSSKNLLVCKIAFADKTRIIQTNASNVQVNTIVIAFVPGSTNGKVTFDSKEIIGIVSEGMLTNPTEFGIHPDLMQERWVEGITAYDGFTIDDDPISSFGLNDQIITVDILSNRSDAASYYVMALELAAYFQTVPLIPENQVGTFTSKVQVDNGKAKSLVFIEAHNDFNISLREQILLAKHDIKAINDATDLTNLTAIYSGQPTHVYDQSQVGTSFQAEFKSGVVQVFGNKDVSLNQNLVITSSSKTVAIASVIGIDKLAVTQTTQHLLFELGIFPIVDVRKNVKTVKLDTYASSQGTKVLTLGTTEFAIKYLSNKLKHFSQPINFKPKSNQVVNFDLKKVSKIAGEDITKMAQYQSALKSLTILGFKINGNIITIPSYRHDVNSQQDINEEFLRIIGYDNFSFQTPSIMPSPIQNLISYHEKAATLGYFETKLYTLISRAKNVINPFGFTKTIALSTYVSEHRTVIRNSQAMSLLEVAEYNHNRGLKQISLFAEGMINRGTKTLALLSNTKSFQVMQKDVSNLIPGVSFTRFETSNVHPHVSAKIMYENQMIGWIGKLHPSLSKLEVIVAEFKIADYRIACQFHEYQKSPLKFTDVNYDLSKHEDLGKQFSSDQKAYRQEVIDEYQEGDKKRVTVRTYKS